MGDEAVERAARAIREALDVALEPRTSELVRVYLVEPDRYGTGFAGLTFNELDQAGTSPDVWSCADLLAVTTLDVRVRPTALRSLLAPPPNSHCGLLAAIPSDVALWDRDTARVDEALQRAKVAWDDLCNLPGVGWVMAGKLLARKRPELVPVCDTVVLRELGLTQSSPYWRSLRQVLIDAAIRERVAALHPAECPPVGLLRLLDIALWMLGRGSRAARAAREDAGFG